MGVFLEEAAPAPAPAPRSEPRHLDGGLYRLHVRFSDVDVFGHVNNVKYFEYFQEARIPLMNHLTTGLPKSGRHVVVAHMQVDYLRPIYFRAQNYDVWSWISHVGGRALTIESEIRGGEDVFSRAKVVMVFFDPATQRSMAPPADLMVRLQEFMAREG